MKASELKPGQFFEFANNARRLCVWQSSRFTHYVSIARSDQVMKIANDTEVTPLAVTGWDDESEPVSISKELNIDAGTEQFELARALHRVVRAMHDGHCPKCGHLACSMEFEPSEGYHCCPNCEFAITKEESDEALAMFLPYMQKNYDKFVAWQLHGRFVKPLQLREGAKFLTREGKETGPLRTTLHPDFPWGDGGHTWTAKGTYWSEFDIQSRRDLIAEVPPPVEPVHNPIPQQGDHYDYAVNDCDGHGQRTDKRGEP